MENSHLNLICSNLFNYEVKNLEVQPHLQIKYLSPSSWEFSVY